MRGRHRFGICRFCRFVGRGRTPPRGHPGKCCAAGKKDPSGRFAASSPKRGAFLRGKQPKATPKGKPLTGSRVKASPYRGGVCEADGGVGTFLQSGTLRATKNRAGSRPRPTKPRKILFFSYKKRTKRILTKKAWVYTHAFFIGISLVLSLQRKDISPPLPSRQDVRPG